MPASYPDFTLSCTLHVQGELPVGLTERWSLSRRFGRLLQQGEFLVTGMDVIAVGGVNPTSLRSHIKLWDRLLQGFITYLCDHDRLVVEQQDMAQDVGQSVDGEVRADAAGISLQHLGVCACRSRRL